MDINEDYQMTKARSHYACRPLVDRVKELELERDQLAARNARLCELIGDIIEDESYLSVANVVLNESPAANIAEIEARAVERALSTLASEYESGGLSLVYSGRDVAQHIEAQSKYYSEKIRNQHKEEN